MRDRSGCSYALAADRPNGSRCKALEVICRLNLPAAGQTAKLLLQIVVNSGRLVGYSWANFPWIDFSSDHNFKTLPPSTYRAGRPLLCALQAADHPSHYGVRAMGLEYMAQRAMAGTSAGRSAFTLSWKQDVDSTKAWGRLQVFACALELS